MYMCVPDKSAKITKRTATQDIPKIAAKRKRRYELPGSIQKCVVFKKKCGNYTTLPLVATKKQTALYATLKQTATVGQRAWSKTANF